MLALPVKAAGPESLMMTANERREGKPQYCTVQGMGLSCDVRNDGPVLRTGVFDCELVDVGLVPAFEDKSLFAVRTLIGFKEWTLESSANYYAAKAGSVSKLMGGARSK